jgi:hypothetical protein
MFRTIKIAALFTTVSLAMAAGARAENVYDADEATETLHMAPPDDGNTDGIVEANSDERLLIVNANRRRVIYDDGRDDLYCVTRVIVAGYNCWGRPYYRRVMRCR